jgi:hypothetical protein
MAYTLQTQYNSPNYTPAASVPAVYGRPRKVKYLTIHHWGAFGQSHSGVVNYLCRAGGNTSAHYVASAGLVTCIVAPQHAAWHSGNAVGNAESVGLELRPEATEADYQTAAELIADLRKVYGDVPLVPHKHWHNTACPGKWDLAKLDRMARAVASGKAPIVKPATPTAPKPIPTKEPELTAAEIKAAVREVLDEADTVEKFARRFLRYHNTTRTERDLYALIVDAGLNAASAKALLGEVLGRTAALQALVTELTKRPDASSVDLQRVVDEAVASLRVTLVAEPKEAVTE